MICPCCGKPKRPTNLDGLGTALKPAMELIAVARKPLSEKTIAANVIKHGTGALNIDGCRVGDDPITQHGRSDSPNRSMESPNYAEASGRAWTGRWPANVCHDGSDEVLAAFPETTSGTFSGKRNEPKTRDVYGKFALQDERGHIGDTGSAARFFYTAKADALDRHGSKHPTVKPVSLMRWLCRLVTPPGGTILDPFAGTGTTGLAAMCEGFDAILIEREADYFADIERRLAWARGEGRLTAQETRRSGRSDDVDHGLFASLAHPYQQEGEG